MSEHRWQDDISNHQRNNRTSPPAPALPGIATFLQQPLSTTQQEHSGFRPFSASTDHALRQQQLYQQQLQPHRYYHQSQQHDSTNSNNNQEQSKAAADFTSYTRLLDASSISYQQRTPTRSPTNSNTSGSPPNLSGFKNIAINSNSVSSGHHSSEYSNSTSASATTGGSAPARTHANYKPNARKHSGNGGTSHRPLTRTSRYLREVDRRNILRRIEQGEKQANLAKEYQVSRAAISNLKQRRNRKDSQRDGTEGDSEEKGESESDTGSFHNHPNLLNPQHHEQPQEQQEIEQFTPEATSVEFGQRGHHRPVRRPSSFTSESYHSESDQPAFNLAPPLSLSPLRLATSPSHNEQKTIRSLPFEATERVVQANTATVKILFARLMNKRTDPRSLQNTKSRIARLLLEQAMSGFPVREVEIPVPVPGSGSRDQQAPASSSYIGTDFVKPICAVAVSNHQEHATSGMETLLQEFQMIEPFSETGSVVFASPGFRSSIAATSMAAEDCTIQIPPSIHESHALLLVDTLSTRSVQDVAIAIQATLRSGTQQQDICLVTMAAHEHAVAYLLEVFPHLRVLTAKVLPREDPSSNGILEFLHARLRVR